jgi:hypothetical protein
MPDDVAARVERVDERLRDLRAQQSRLDEDIAALQKKRQFLLGLADPVDVAARSLPVPAPAQPPPVPRDDGAKAGLDAVLSVAQTQVGQLLSESQRFAARTQEIVGWLTALNNLLVLAAPESRQRLGEFGRNIGLMLSGMVQKDADQAAAPTAGPEAGTTSASGLAGLVPQLLGLLQSPVIGSLIASLTAPPAQD